MGIQFNLIVARCKNNGIGYKGQLPWSLRNEMQYFGRMTKEVKDPEKKNAVVMGRKTWDSLPKKWQPLPGRFNFVLSTQSLNITGAVVCSDFNDVIKKINSPEYIEKVETVWIIGGTKVYEDACSRNICHRLYVTEILKDFECDTFLHVDVNKGFKEVRYVGQVLMFVVPKTEFPSEAFRDVHFGFFSDERVPNGVQEENGVQYIYHVYEKIP